MSIVISDNYKFSGLNFLDNRVKVNSLTDLKGWKVGTNPIPPGFEVCVNGSWYIYDPGMTEDPETGFFKLRDSDKQDALVSGVNISTINGHDLLEGGNLVIESGSGGSTIMNGETPVEEIGISYSKDDIAHGSDKIFSGGAIYDYVTGVINSLPLGFGFSISVSDPNSGNIYLKGSTQSSTVTLGAVIKDASHPSGAQVREQTAFEYKKSTDTNYTPFSGYTKLIEGITASNSTYNFKGTYNGNTNYNSITYKFGTKYLFGSVATKYSSASDVDLEDSNLTLSGPTQKPGTIKESYTTTQSLPWPVIAIPSDWGTISKVLDPNGFTVGDWNRITGSFTRALSSSFTETYKVYQFQPKSPSYVTNFTYTFTIS